MNPRVQKKGFRNGWSRTRRPVLVSFVLECRVEQCSCFVLWTIRINLTFNKDLWLILETFGICDLSRENVPFGIRAFGFNGWQFFFAWIVRRARTASHPIHTAPECATIRVKRASRKEHFRVRGHIFILILLLLLILDPSDFDSNVSNSFKLTIPFYLFSAYQWYYLFCYFQILIWCLPQVSFILPVNTHSCKQPLL